MRNHSYLLPISVFCALLFVSCSVEEFDETIFEEDQTLFSKAKKEKKDKSKIEICHFNQGTNSYERITVSENGLNGHLNHEHDILVFDEDGDGYPARNECGINFREDGLWDLDDNNRTIQDEVDCFSHIIGHYYGSTNYGSIVFELDFDVSKEGDYYYINGSLNERGKSDGYVLRLKIDNVNEMFSKFYSFQYEGTYPINSGSGYYDCGKITCMIGISGSGIPGVQAFNAVRTK